MSKIKTWRGRFLLVKIYIDKKKLLYLSIFDVLPLKPARFESVKQTVVDIMA